MTDIQHIADGFKKILVVDDILYVLKSISKILREEGYFVVTARNGKEALFKFKNLQPDLITVDQRLPDMSGIELVQEIKRMEGNEDIKIVFISAFDEKETIHSSLNLGINHFLLKPFKKKRLIDIVSNLIGE